MSYKDYIANNEIWQGEGFYRIAFSDSGQAYGGKWYEDEEDLANDFDGAEASETESHRAYIETVPYYSVYKKRVLRYQFADSYEERDEGSEGAPVREFYPSETSDSASVDARYSEFIDDPRERAIEFAKNLRDENLDEFTVYHAKQGLDSIEYSVWEVWEISGVDADCVLVGCFSTVTEEREKAIERAKRSYWDYLDYEEDSYHGVEV